MAAALWEATLSVVEEIDGVVKLVVSVVVRASVGEVVVGEAEEELSDKSRGVMPVVVNSMAALIAVPMSDPGLVERGCVVVPTAAPLVALAVVSIPKLESSRLVVERARG